MKYLDGEKEVHLELDLMKINLVLFKLEYNLYQKFLVGTAFLYA